MRFLSAWGKSSMSSLMISIRSCSKNNGPLPMLMNGPITSRSTKRNERRTISVWPLVTGSNVPGYTPTRSVAIAGGCIVLADAHGGHHALPFADIDDAHAAGGTARDANSVHWATDQCAAVGHQHDLIAVEYRECRHHLAAAGEAHQLDALAAAAGDPILVGRGALAEA